MNKIQINPNLGMGIFSDKIHKRIEYISKLTDTPYHHVFTLFLDYLQEGHVIEDYTHKVIIERILTAKRRAENEGKQAD